MRAMLDDLGIAWEERPSVPRSASDGGPWGMVVATPQRILELRSTPGPTDAVPHIAVCDGFSRMLSKKLNQARVDFVLRRPVHPGALRLLLLHAWYRGPEKRRTLRVSIGAPVRVRIGWSLRARVAMLLELSGSGCRLQLDRTAPAGRRLEITLPRELTGKRPIRLKGRVVRRAAAIPGDEARRHEAAVQFGPLGSSARMAVHALVDQHGKGPAAWKDGPTQRPAPVEPSRPARSTESPPSETPPDRRRSPRLRYAKPVLVKGEGASRVLMGQDLSSGGMRVMRDPSLAVGDELKLALYGEDGIPPLMLQARVAREDGPFLVLLFAELGGESKEQIERFMASSPVTSGEAGEDTALVVSEIVEQG